MRAGANEEIRRDPETDTFRHTVPNVYKEMIIQITLDYPGLSDPRTLSMAEIRFWFEGLRGGLLKTTKPK